jgi:hypothetical protein
MRASASASDGAGSVGGLRGAARTPGSASSSILLACLPALVLVLVLATSALPTATAQAPGGGDAADPQKGDQQSGTTALPRAPGSPTGGRAHVAVTAYLTETSPAISQGLVWRVYRDKAGPGGKPALVSTQRDTSPTLKLDPGTYYINVAYGRANLTRKLTVAADQVLPERFVLNAGGLRLVPVMAGGEPANTKLVSYDVESDERDEYGQRIKVVSGVKAGVMLRLNAGLYSIVSTYGDANAMARADVTVEAGKLTEVNLTHYAATVSFKLVTRSGGEAIADTQWSVLNAEGASVKESSGALPTHFLAPGRYAVRATHSGRVFKQDFTVKAGDNTLVEVIMP